ncbi:hypothetical protein L1887_63081 [Cichorium endivia]|nr:hypothetical protein L1887_63081 [Cichorium endivia]
MCCSRCLCWNRELTRATEQDEAGGIPSGVACAVARSISAATQTSANATCCYEGRERVPPWLGGAGGSLGENPGSGIYSRRSAFVRVEVAAAECASSSQVEKKKGGRWGPRTPGGAILLKSRGRAEGRVGRNARKKLLSFAISNSPSPERLRCSTQLQPPSSCPPVLLACPYTSRGRLYILLSTLHGHSLAFNLSQDDTAAQSRAAKPRLDKTAPPSDYGYSAHVFILAAPTRPHKAASDRPSARASDRQYRIGSEQCPTSRATTLARIWRAARRAAAPALRYRPCSARVELGRHVAALASGLRVAAQLALHLRVYVGERPLVRGGQALPPRPAVPARHTTKTDSAPAHALGAGEEAESSEDSEAAAVEAENRRVEEELDSALAFGAQIVQREARALAMAARRLSKYSAQQDGFRQAVRLVLRATTGERGGKVLDEDLAAGERCEQVDLDVNVEVVLPALEARVWLFVDDDDDVAGDGVGRLVGLFLEGDVLAVLHALVDAHLEHLALLVDLFAVALLAAVLCVDDLAVALALWAGLLHLLHHGTELSEHDLDTLAVASAARLYGALLAAAAVALFAEDVLLERKLGDLAGVELLERDLDAVDEVLALAWAARAAALTAKEAAASAAEELGEEVLWVHAATHSAALEALLSEAVVEVALVRVGEHLVCSERSGDSLRWGDGCEADLLLELRLGGERSAGKAGCDTAVLDLRVRVFARTLGVDACESGGGGDGGEGDESPDKKCLQMSMRVSERVAVEFQRSCAAVERHLPDGQNRWV